MVSRFIILAVAQAVFLQTITGQVINRVLPNGPILPLTETFIPNANFLPQNLIPFNQFPCGVETVLPNQYALPATTVVQDSTVANNLANALQLLVVSNLLSTTLPGANEVILPGYAGYPGGYEYVNNVVPPVAVSPCSPYGLGPATYLY